MKRWFAFVLSLAAVLAGATGAVSAAQDSPARVYFDAHNHFTGILPYYAYANLPAFIEHFSNPKTGVTQADRLALYHYLDRVWFPADGVKLGDELFSPPDGQRFALGARAALALYRQRIARDPADVNGVLERVLTATPWTEFDSAYAFRGGPAEQYLRSTYYAGDALRLQNDLCKATVLDLAATNIEVSEQSLPFIGGWHFKNGVSKPMNTIQCVMGLLSGNTLDGTLKTMGKPKPRITFVFMTHTSQLATLPGGKTYAEWSKTGVCAPVPLPHGLITTPKTIYEALLGKDDDGKSVVPAAELPKFYDYTVGIDTAAPETTCFSPDGMAYYRQLIEAVYDASKVRRQAGWRGKLLVHTHVGEGSVIDYAPVPPPQPWTFASMFEKLPPQRTNDEQARMNITMLLDAIAKEEAAHPDLHEYVVFRLAHDTWADWEQAKRMHAERVEADVNLESNVATGAYPISRMPLGTALIDRYWIDPQAANPNTNLQLNNLLGSLVRNPSNVRQVGSILGGASLKFLLENHVRCLLGTDADGVEHSDIVKEYEYGSSLIAYWNRTDPQFRRLAAGVTEQTLFDNVQWHLKDMTTDTAMPY